MDVPDLTLNQLLTRGIQLATQVIEADSPNSAQTQSRLQRALSDLTLSASLVSRLGVLSPNEQLDDVHTRDLRCLLVDALRGQCCTLAKTKGAQERIDWLHRAKTHFEDYVALVNRYDIVPDGVRAAFAGPQHSTVDPSRRRQGKIAQFRMERDVKNQLEELRRRRRERRSKTRNIASTTTGSSSSAAAADDVSDELAYESEDDDADADDIARPLYIHLIRLHYLRSFSELASLEQELELLAHSIKMSEIPSGRGASASEGRGQGRARGGDDDGEGEGDRTWRLDRDAGGIGQVNAPLLDPQGRVLRPFTILPSSSSSTQSPLHTRLRLQSEVFRPSHNLPTMTIDEYLDEQASQGNILQGGGPNSSAAVAQAREDERGDKEFETDTRRGYEAEESELSKLRIQDEWKDEHRRGEGNMHNRG